MDWLEFLEDVATECGLEDLQRSAFVARFEVGNSRRTDVQVALGTKDELGRDVFTGAAAFTKLMTAVYGKVEVLWPELVELKKGKKTRLAALLQAEFKRRRDGEPPVRPLLGAKNSGANKSGLKPGAPWPRVRLPENFVARPGALAAVKEKLLRESEQTLVVSAIAGLGGLGKSVLATALVQDTEVQGRFEDGILWITLGQNPDLQNCLGDWIRALDKSRDSFSATTLESAKGYLHNLLVERRMLLVVDDVWNSDEAEWFRVGGAGCRVLVTTRKEEIEGADCYSLDLMTEAEAIELVRRKLGKKWRFSGGETTSTADEAAFLGFAKSLGYLPLALDLAANLVRDGVGWGELRAEFEAERRDVALGLLDSTEEDWEHLPEEKRRKYSLQACFNLSLNRLNELQRSQFAWLGVLPEDVNLTVATGRVLWDLSSVQTKRVLKALRSRSLLMDGPKMMDGERSYRVHDLMHDMARGLIEKGAVGVEGLVEAHRSFLGRYRGLCGDGLWWKPPYDRERPYEYLYFYRHLTWHLELADWVDEVHDLMAASDEQGRNAWFEACEEVGEPGTFVQDVNRGWGLAANLYERDREKSIVLQGRYALIIATLNSLLDQLPVKMMAAFVKGGFWSVERAWTYVEQMRDDGKIADAIYSLAVYLTEPLFQVVVEKAQLIQDEYSRAGVLIHLAEIDNSYFAKALEAVCSMQDEFCWKAYNLQALAKLDFAKALEAAYSIQDEDCRAETLMELFKLNPADHCSQLLDAARSTMDEYWYSHLLNLFDLVDFSEALAAARSIQVERWRDSALEVLAMRNYVNFSQQLTAAQAIQDESHRARTLSSLSPLNSTDFSQQLTAAQLIQNESLRARTLSSLSPLNSADFLQLLNAVLSIQTEYSRVEALMALAEVDSADLSQVLTAAQSIQNEHWREKVIRSFEPAYFPEQLAAERSIQDEGEYAEFLRSLAQIDSTYFSEAWDAARAIKDNIRRDWMLSSLVQLDSDNFSLLLAVAQSIQDKYPRRESLRLFNPIHFSDSLSVACSIQDESRRAWALSSLTKLDSADFSQLLDAAQSIKREDCRAWVLNSLVKLDSADFLQLLNAAQSIQSEQSLAKVLISLAQLNSVDFSQLLEAARSIQSEYSRARILIALVPLNYTCFPEALDAIRAIQNRRFKSEAHHPSKLAM
jgi:hypothetical protein